MNTTTTTATAATTETVLRAVLDRIACKVAALSYETDTLPEYRAARHAAVRSLAAWAAGDRDIVVTVTDGRYQYLTAEVLDTASVEFDLGVQVQIHDTLLGARLIWR